MSEYETAEDRPLLRIRDLAERLGVSEKTAKVLVYGDPRRGKEPEIESFMIGERMRRIEPAEVDRWIAAQQDQRTASE